MGKGTIISAYGDGQYELEINYDRTNYENRISVLDSNIAELETKLAGLEPDSSEYKLTNLQKTALEKNKKSLESAMPSDRTVSAWCLDYTDDLSGEVGTVELNGESESVLIQPGYEDNAVYDVARDGQLVPTITQGAAQAFYNLAMLPGWQKWMPTFRRGVITSIDVDIASVTLSAAKSSQQNLNINQLDLTLEAVPIEYMNCNGAAFEVGDIVIVKFEGQDVESPKIIGFESDPMPCELRLALRPKFNGNYAVNGNQIIKYVYTFESVTKTKFTQIYGDYSSNLGLKTVEQCSMLISFDSSAELEAFFDTATFYVCSLPTTGYSKEVTFFHWYEINIPDSFHPESNRTFTMQIGTGDGTNQPPIMNVPMDHENIPFGFSKIDLLTGANSSFYIRSENVSDGGRLGCYLDTFGFSGYRRSWSDLIQGQLNVETGEWDIPLIFKDDKIPNVGEPINMTFTAANSYDWRGWGGDHYYKRVNYIESDNVIDKTNFEEITLEDGSKIKAYNISFSGLHVTQMVPNERAEEDYLVGAGGMVDTFYEEERWVDAASKPYIDPPLSPYTVGSFTFGYVREHEITISGSNCSSVLQGIMSQPDGSLPTFTGFSYAFRVWLTSYYRLNLEDTPEENEMCGLFCDGRDGCSTGAEGEICPNTEAHLASLGECPCYAGENDPWHWDYAMITTPAEAF